MHYLDKLTAAKNGNPIFEEAEEKIKEREIDLEGSFQQFVLSEKMF